MHYQCPSLYLVLFSSCCLPFGPVLHGTLRTHLQCFGASAVIMFWHVCVLAAGGKLLETAAVGIMFGDKPAPQGEGTGAGNSAADYYTGRSGVPSSLSVSVSVSVSE